MHKPIPSSQTVEEINAEAQARLEARRRERARTERFLFGHPKQEKEKHGKVVFTQ